LHDSISLLIRKEGMMGRSYSSDLRERVVMAIAGGMSTRQAAARFGVGISTAGKWYRRFRDHGETAARRQGHPPGSKLDSHEGFILDLVANQPDITLSEIAERLAAERGTSAVVSTVWTFFARRAITFKKRLLTRPSSSGPMSRRRARTGVIARASSIR
jgi:transposase